MIQGGRILPLAPNVGAQHPSRDFRVGSPVDGSGLVFGGRALPLLDLVKDRNVYSDSLCEFTKRAGEGDFLHVHNLDVSSTFVNRQIHLTGTVHPIHDSAMATQRETNWLYQWRFRELADELEARGTSKEEQATGIGISFSSFLTWYSGKREPGKKTIKLMCAYYKVPLAELTDDPGTIIEGVDPDLSASMTPAKRLIMRSVAQKLSPEDVTDEAAERMWKAIDSLIEAGKIRPPR